MCQCYSAGWANYNLVANYAYRTYPPRLLAPTSRPSDAYKWTIIGSDNAWCQIIWNSAGILLIWTTGTNISEILSKIYIFSYKKMHLKMSSAKWRQLCLCLKMLVSYILVTAYLAVWWRHEMEKLPALMVLCEENPPVIGVPSASNADLWCLFEDSSTNCWVNTRTETLCRSCDISVMGVYYFDTMAIDVCYRTFEACSLPSNSE